MKRAIDEAASKKGYMEITRILFANTGKDGKVLTDFGETLYKEDIRYIKPKIYYNGLSSEKRSADLYFKPYISRMMEGEADVLWKGRVTRFVTSSATTSDAVK